VKRGMVAAVVTAATLLVPVLPAAAKTTVKVDGDDVTITVPIDCVGCKGKKARDGSDLAKYWEKTAEDAWNAAFDKYPFCSKYKFKLDIHIEARGDGFQFTEGRHRILAGLPGSGLAQTGWDGVFESAPGGDPGQRSPDGTRYFENDGDGSMGADATPTVIIHEFGHVIGLGDDRDDNGNVVTGRDRTVMAGGSTNSDGTRNTQNSRLKFDQQLIDRIGNQLANLGKIKCGEVWKGTLHSKGGAVGCPTEVWDGSVALRVTGDGKIVGTGELATTLALDCAGEPAATYTEEFTVRGKAAPGRLALLFRDQTDTCLGIAADPTVSIACWGVPGGKIKRAGKQARGTFATDLAGATQYRTTLKLRCVHNCELASPGVV
jgi:hypothetical protein